MSVSAGRRSSAKGGDLAVQRDISYSIIIPEDPNALGDDLLSTTANVARRKGGFVGETLSFWLVAKWDEETSHLGKMDWLPELFTSEIVDVEFKEREGYVSTTEVVKLAAERTRVTTEWGAAVPLTVNLPKKPASAVIKIWKDNFSTLVTSLDIDITLPVEYTVNFGVKGSVISIAFDFGESSVDDYSLHFKPLRAGKLAQYHDAFALKHVEGVPTFELSFATKQAIQLITQLQLWFTVIWCEKRMMSNFVVTVPLKKSPLSVLWLMPPLARLKQARLVVELENVTAKSMNVIVEMEKSDVMLPLERTFSVEGIVPGEKRVVPVSVVPTMSGIHKLLYKVQVNGRCFTPLFDTIVEIQA